jgi:hypothetical protein
MEPWQSTFLPREPLALRGQPLAEAGTIAAS